MPTKIKNSRSNKVTHKKRRGDHHAQSKHYLKVYWPYVPMLLIVMLGLFFGSPQRMDQSGVLAYATEMSSGGLLYATNNQRATSGKSSLKLNSSLNSAAQAKANDMVARNYWSHNTPDGQEPWIFIDNTGYSYTKAGENLAYGFGTSNETITGWMNSPTHRDNMLDGGFSEVGFGYANGANFNGDGEETVVVAMYAQPAVAVAPAPQRVAPATTKQAPAPAPATAAPTAEPSPTPTPAQATVQDTAVPAEKSTEPVTTARQSTVEPASTEVSKLQTLTGGNAPWIAFAVGLFSGASVLFLSIKHSLAFKKRLIHGEQFLLHHPMLDIALVGCVMLGYALSHTSGFIR